MEAGASDWRAIENVVGERFGKIDFVLQCFKRLQKFDLFAGHIN